MKRWSFRCVLLALSILLFVSLFSLVSCIGRSQSTQSDFNNAGATDANVTGAQFDQYTLFRFDTSTSGHTFTLPSASDIVANLSSPYAGEVVYLAVAADGGNPVTLIGGTNVTVKPSALTVPADTTLTMYCELDNITSGSEMATIY
jgi:hypothetical protein